MGNWQIKSNEICASKMHISGILNSIDYIGSIHVYNISQPQIPLKSKQHILCAIYQQKIQRIEIQWKSNQSMGILILKPMKQQQQQKQHK